MKLLPGIAMLLATLLLQACDNNSSNANAQVPPVTAQLQAGADYRLPGHLLALVDESTTLTVGLEGDQRRRLGHDR